MNISPPKGLVDAMLGQGLTSADAHGITDEALEAAYAQGYQALSEGWQDDAM